MADEFEQYFEPQAEDSFEQYFEPPTTPRPLEGLEAFGSGVISAVPGAKQLVALRAAVRGGDPSLPGLQFDEGESFGSRYAKARRAIAPEQERLAEAHPGVGGAGTATAIVAQLGGPTGVANLLRSAPQLIRGLLSRGVLTPQALGAAIRGGLTAAGYGVALSDADIPLAEGNVAEAGSQAWDAATDPTTLALGGTLGLASGAATERLRRVAASAAEKAAKVKELGRVEAAEAAHPQEVAKAKLAAIEATRAPTPDNATRWFGLDRLTGQPAATTRARAVRLMNEPVPGQTETWMAARQRFGDDVAGWQQYVDDTKSALGESIGQVRESLAKAPGARVDAAKLKEKLAAAIGPLPTEKAEKLLEKANKLVDDAADGGSIGASKLRQIVKNLEEGKAWRLRSAAVEMEKRLVAEHLPEQNDAYRRLLNNWSDANELSRGAEKQYLAMNRGTAPVRLAKPEPVEVPKPTFAGGPDARAEAEALLKPQYSTGQEILRSLVRATGGATGAAVGQGSGVPFAGYAGAATGYQSGNTLADRWIKATRPTIGGIIAESDAAARAMQRWAPHLDAALRRGPRVVRAVHRALMQADPDYKEMFDSAGRTEVAPLSFGEFSSGWRGR